MKEKFIKINRLSVAKKLADFVNNELLKETDITPDQFWKGFDEVVHELSPKNRELLEIRKTLKQKIDSWHKNNRTKEFNLKEYQNFLKKIGYLKEEGPDFKIKTENLDEEISKIAGPQLVVPIMNARYTLNAANARWMSLYDSLYGTDVIDTEECLLNEYDPIRVQKVINYSRDFLNKNFPINEINWKDITALAVKDGKLIIRNVLLL